MALIGAGSRGEFREEDQIGCAWIAQRLLDAGYAPQNTTTAAITQRWRNAKATDCLGSHSVGYLRRTGQLADLDFILDRVDDLNDAFILQNDEVIAAPASEPVWSPGLVPIEAI